MDTREKIVPLEDLPSRLGAGHWLAVAGLFDPLTLDHASRLAKLSERGTPLIVVIEPGPSCLLPATARAALVAALRSVRLVVIAETAAVLHPQIEIMADPEGERQRSAEFMQLIARRQTAQ